MGIRDNALSERLQLDSNLTLEKVKKTVRQREAVHDHSQQLNPLASKQESMTVETVKKVNIPVVRPGGKHIMLAKAQGINNHVSDVVKAMDIYADKYPAKKLKAICYRCNRKEH